MTLDARTLADWDHRHVWHPFTQMEEWLAAEPLIVERGEGNELVDVDGRRYLDGVSSLWCNVHGHRKREIDDAVRDQLDRIAHSTMLGLANVPATVLAKRLADIARAPLTRVFYSDAGATAVEIALKIAFQYWQLRGEERRTVFASLAEAYHGDTLGSVSLGYSEGFHRFFRPILFPTLRLSPPHVFRFYRGLDAADAVHAALEEARRELRARAPEIAGVFVEPLVQGAAGMWTHPTEYLRGLRELTSELGLLLICDEVATGFGRTGTMLAIEQAGIAPDLLCVAKGLTGGYLPLAATLASEEIFSAFLGRYEERKAFFHGHTYTGNPLACAAALASLAVFEAEGVLERFRRRIATLAELLDREIAPLPNVAEVRRAGGMVGIELMRDPARRVAYDPGQRIGNRVILAARRRGVIIRPLGDVVVLMPPLSITEAELATLVGVTAESIREVTAE
ncbi:MAG: adenosylmethionine---8-amino-7-oxononanoate aminotransferase [Candidatus Binatota bacterium]|nr:adenosylmethionine---8-amino-7-oxononanoate aminotransferase [Candidatus Binatota bacterium]